MSNPNQVFTDYTRLVQKLDTLVTAATLEVSHASSPEDLARKNARLSGLIAHRDSVKKG
jgi:hypothetical protein